MDKLEQFIKDKRSEFDTLKFEGELRLWAAIEQDLFAANATTKRVELLQTKTKSRLWLMPLMRVAAAILLLVVGAAGGWWWSGKTTMASTAATAATQNAEQSPDWKEAETYYNQQVADKVAVLASYETTDPTVLADLKQIDEVQKELRAELDQAPTSSREQIVATMIKNYRIKLDILERVLRSMEEKNINASNHSSTTTIKNDSL
jgi:hypothetical protein